MTESATGVETPGAPRRGNQFSRALGRTARRLFGWRCEGRLPSVPRCVIIAAPHTSNWDFFFGLCLMFEFGLRADWIGKHTMFRRPFGGIMRWLGGVPIVRIPGEGKVEQIVATIRDRERYALTMAPEGTRKQVERWRTGFWHVARQAGVPIVLAYFDYSRKVVGLGPTFETTDDIEDDMRRLHEFYRANSRARYPSQSRTGLNRGVARGEGGCMIRVAREDSIPNHFESAPLHGAARACGATIAAAGLFSGLGFILVGQGEAAEVAGTLALVLGGLTAFFTVRCQRFETTVGSVRTEVGAGPFRIFFATGAIEHLQQRPATGWRRLFADREVLVEVGSGPGRVLVPSRRPEELIEALRSGAGLDA